MAFTLGCGVDVLGTPIGWAVLVAGSATAVAVALGVGEGNGRTIGMAVQMPYMVAYCGTHPRIC
ncbi:MAG UNVERIFIED_CONTAM: hypothetical protein LVT10_05060 [Anaerolineae bacterium]